MLQHLASHIMQSNSRHAAPSIASHIMQCMELYFGIYMDAIKRARDGDFSQHIVLL